MSGIQPKIYARNAIQAFSVSVYLQAFLVVQLLALSSALLWEWPCLQQWPSCLPGTRTLVDAGAEGLWSSHVSSTGSLTDEINWHKFFENRNDILWKATGGRKDVKRDEGQLRICAAQT